MPDSKKEKPNIENITSYNSILLGLMGHVDSGKTAIAKMISEIISTSGLDAHPQSKKRGITIDLGFTSLILDQNLITLVDAPGHADLIRSVVASANIIEGAILVIDASKGIQIQTAEHLVILESLGIKNLIVILNKIDLVSGEQTEKLTKQVRITLKDTSFNQSYEIIRTSTKAEIGKKDLIDGIKNLVGFILEERRTSQKDSGSTDLIYPIDHHFKIKGQGVIVTGTTLEGSVKRNQDAVIIPQKKKIKIKSLQIYYQDVDEAPQGFRVGARISGIDVENMSRGNIITRNPEIFRKGELLKIKLQMNKYFKKDVPFGAQINATFGLTTENARIFPFICKENQEFIIDSVNRQQNRDEKNELYAYVWLFEPNYIKTGTKVLLSQLDLPPTSLRFFGTGIIEEVLTDNIPELGYYKIKKGTIRNAAYGKGQILAEGLAQSKDGAETLIGKKLDEPRGTIESTFGNKGVVVVDLDQSKSQKLDNGGEILLKMLRTTKLDRNKSYRE